MRVSTPLGLLKAGAICSVMGLAACQTTTGGTQGFNQAPIDPVFTGGCGQSTARLVPSQDDATSVRIHFATDACLPTDEHLAVVLQAVRQARAENPGAPLKAVVWGHTDERASVPHNDRLSNGRSVALRNLLRGEGVEVVERLACSESLPTGAGNVPRDRSAGAVIGTAQQIQPYRGNCQRVQNPDFASRFVPQ